MSVGARRILRSAPTVLVRTIKHPAVDDIVHEGVRVSSFDHLYETCENFEQVYASIACAVLELAQDGDVVYAVPGHPLVGEETVRIILGESEVRGVPVRIVGSASFIEACLEALVIPVSAGIKIVDALSLGQVRPDPEVGNLIYQIYDRMIASEVKLRLMENYPDEHFVKLIKGAGTASQVVSEIPLYELDRCDVDHLTALFVPPISNGQGSGDASS